MDEDERREEQVVEDTDADTRDVETNERDDMSDIRELIGGLSARVSNLTDMVSAMQKAQVSLVDRGGVIREEEYDEPDNTDSFVPIEKLDFSIK